MITLHLVASPVWDAQRHNDVYVPEAFAADGFVHCTDGEQSAIDTANRYYQGDPRPYVVLSIDTDALTAPLRYEDSARIYPHVYGPIETAAVTAVREVDRDADGGFVRIASAPHGPPGDQ
jgi:uncharacterized protein (DUF952 family)